MYKSEEDFIKGQKIKIFLIVIGLLIAIFLHSCKQPKPKVPSHIEIIQDSLDRNNILSPTSNYYDLRYTVFYLDGCEYIRVGTGSNSWGAHKGDCKNPIHKIKN